MCILVKYSDIQHIFMNIWIFLKRQDTKKIYNTLTEFPHQDQYQDVKDMQILALSSTHRKKINGLAYGKHRSYIRTNLGKEVMGKLKIDKMLQEYCLDRLSIYKCSICFLAFTQWTCHIHQYTSVLNIIVYRLQKELI